MTDPVLVATGLTFSYGRWRPQQVLTGLDWTVPPGATTLLLGPNGAGKSTLLKLLCGFEEPDAGKVAIAGRTGRRALYDAVGWMPQDVQPARGLTVLEQVEYAAWIGGESRRSARELAREALADVDLEDKRDVRADRLSGGQLRRVGLAQAVVRRAPVLLLDEPTAGLDPAQAINFQRLLRKLDCPGGIVISTHQPSDLAGEVDQVAVLVGGSLRFEGTVDAFCRQGPPGGDRQRSVAQAFAAMVGGGGH